MSFYIKIKDQVYQVPNRFILGRGEPFDILKSDNKVSRSHLLIIKKSNFWYIKDLRTKYGTKVNDKYLKSRKPHAVGEDDVILIGNHSLTLYLQKPSKEYIKVSTINMYSGLESIEVRQKSMIISSIIIFGMAFLNKDLTSLPSVMAYLLFSVILSFGLYQFYYFLNPDNIEEITISSTGFTCFFKDETHMTFRPRDIESWRHLKIGPYESIRVKYFNNFYTFVINEQSYSLLNFFEEYVPKKNKKLVLNEE